MEELAFHRRPADFGTLDAEKNVFLEFATHTYIEEVIKQLAQSTYGPSLYNLFGAPFPSKGLPRKTIPFPPAFYFFSGCFCDLLLRN